MDEIKTCIESLIISQKTNIHDVDFILISALWQHLYDYCKKGDLCSRTREMAMLIADVIKESI